MENVKEQILSVIANPIFLSCIFSWLSAQFIKTLIKLFSRKVHSVRELLELLFWRTGGMPSSHTALVTSLTTGIGFSSGVSSDVFMLSLAFLMVTVRDALGVRRASGVQARTLNIVGKSLADKEILDFNPIKEVQGHSGPEVFIGALLGLFVGLAFNIL
ncbi:MAG: divergent PAP2 family protein [Treponema sp.]|nr:divergent PAP2 family protein [Treponema sp.]